MHTIDWTIVVVFILFLTILAVKTNRYTKSVADFLAANRCLGRYLVTMSSGMAVFGAVTFVAVFEMRYEAGFVPSWWMIMMFPSGLIIALTGWVIYRFRETQALTLAQFFEMRYSKKFRVFTGLLIFGCGMVNFGLFPAIGARFFLYFCNIPEVINVLGFDISSYVLMLVILISIALFFTCLGGQIAVAVTDFFQGLLCTWIFVIIAVFFMFKFDWNTITEGLLSAPPQASMIHPFHTSDIREFNIWYFIIALLASFYATMAWQGTSAYNCSAKSPHEAKMAAILGTWWKGIIMVLVLTILPICAYVVMHHSNYASIAESVNNVLNTVSLNTDDTIRKQVTVPVILRHIMPVGMLGAFCAVTVAAFISTHDTYMHSWGTIFVQDVILPFRKKPLSPKRHMLVLRLAIFCVGLFIFIFSLLFRQTQSVYMFFALSGTIWLGGAGSAIIGGLYWKRGTTAAAFTSMITGAVIAILGLILEQIWKSYYGQSFPINGQWIYLIAIVSSVCSYVLVSLFGKKEICDLNRILHRGEYSVSQKTDNSDKDGFLFKSKHATIRDKIVYLLLICYSLGWFLVFVVFSIYNLIFDVSNGIWAGFWHFFVWFHLVLAAITAVWFLIGGAKDITNMFKALKVAQRSDFDDGSVLEKSNLSEN